MPKFDRSRLKILPLSERQHKMTLVDIKKLDDPISDKALDLSVRENIEQLTSRILKSHSVGGKIILAMGAHAIKRGNSRLIIDLMRRGLISHVATNMACAIHDFELAFIGATDEDVSFYITDGRFGNWEETGRYLNEAIQAGFKDNIGLGMAIGRMISSRSEICNKDISIFSAAHELGIPLTVHKGIGYDITDQHPSADFQAIGKTSGDDFLRFTNSISHLEGGVFINLGTAVMGPEIYLKALSMTRNVARQEGREIRHFTTAVFDIVPLGDWRNDKEMIGHRTDGALSDPRYYFRPLKSILIRTVKDGGESFYIEGEFDSTIPCFYKYLTGVQGR